METDEGALEVVKNTALYLILNKLSAKIYNSFAHFKTNKLLYFYSESDVNFLFKKLGK